MSPSSPKVRATTAPMASSPAPLSSPPSLWPTRRTSTSVPVGLPGLQEEQMQDYRHSHALIDLDILRESRLYKQDSLQDFVEMVDYVSTLIAKATKQHQLRYERYLKQLKAQRWRGKGGGQQQQQPGVPVGVVKGEEQMLTEAEWEVIAHVIKRLFAINVLREEIEVAAAAREAQEWLEGVKLRLAAVIPRKGAREVDTGPDKDALKSHHGQPLLEEEEMQKLLQERQVCTQADPTARASAPRAEWSAQKVYSTIASIYFAKIKLDAEYHITGQQRRSLADFIRDYFLAVYVVPSVAVSHLECLCLGVHTFMHDPQYGLRVKVFGVLTGLVRLPHDIDECIGFHQAAADFFLSVRHQLQVAAEKEQLEGLQSQQQRPQPQQRPQQQQPQQQQEQQTPQQQRRSSLKPTASTGSLNNHGRASGGAEMNSEDRDPGHLCMPSPAIMTTMSGALVRVVTHQCLRPLVLQKEKGADKGKNVSYRILKVILGLCCTLRASTTAVSTYGQQRRLTVLQHSKVDKLLAQVANMPVDWFMYRAMVVWFQLHSDQPEWREDAPGSAAGAAAAAAGGGGRGGGGANRKNCVGLGWGLVHALPSTPAALSQHTHFNGTSISAAASKRVLQSGNVPDDKHNKIKGKRPTESTTTEGTATAHLLTHHKRPVLVNGRETVPGSSSNKRAGSAPLVSTTSAPGQSLLQQRRLMLRPMATIATLDTSSSSSSSLSAPVLAAGPAASSSASPSLLPSASPSPPPGDDDGDCSPLISTPEEGSPQFGRGSRAATPSHAEGDDDDDDEDDEDGDVIMDDVRGEGARSPKRQGVRPLRPHGQPLIDGQPISTTSNSISVGKEKRMSRLGALGNLKWACDRRLLLDAHGHETSWEEARAAYLTRRQTRTMTIACRTTYGVYTLRVAQATPVHHIKRDLSRLCEQFPSKAFVVLFKGEELHSFETMEECGVANNNTLILYDQDHWRMLQQQQQQDSVTQPRRIAQQPPSQLQQQQQQQQQQQRQYQQSSPQAPEVLEQMQQYQQGRQRQHEASLDTYHVTHPSRNDGVAALSSYDWLGKERRDARRNQTVQVTGWGRKVPPKLGGIDDRSHVSYSQYKYYG